MQGGMNPKDTLTMRLREETVKENTAETISWGHLAKPILQKATSEDVLFMKQSKPPPNKWTVRTEALEQEQ